MQPTTGNMLFGKCRNCPTYELCKELITEAFNKKGVDEVEFCQWISTDRSTLEKGKLLADEFIQIFHEKVQALLAHNLWQKCRWHFYKTRELINGGFFMIGDFAENYAFIVQDAAQSFHWNNSQVTSFSK